MIHHFLFTAVLAGLLAGCDESVQKGASGLAMSRASCGALTSFSAVNNNVFSHRCAECHGSSRAVRGLNTASYASVYEKLGEIRTKVANGEMPKGGLPQVERDYIVGWIDAGAPEAPAAGARCGSRMPAPSPAASASPLPSALVQGAPSPAPSPAASPATFVSLYEKYFGPRCALCHGAQGAEKQFLFYNDFRLLLKLNDPEGSELIKALRGEDHDLMPPEESGYLPLTHDQIEEVVNWIREGAPETASGDAAKSTAIRRGLF